MSIIIGIIVPAILFLVTLPLQSFLFILRQNLKLAERSEKKKGKGSLKDNLGLSSGSDALRKRLGLNLKNKKGKKSSNLKIMRLKVMKKVIKSISMLISFLRTVASTLMTLVLSAVMMLLPVILVLVISTSGIMMFLGDKNGGTTYGNLVASQKANSSSSNKKSSGGGAGKSKLSGNNVKVSGIRYAQCSYTSTSINSSTPMKYGCGWCALSHMMMNLNPEKCDKMTPVDWISIMPDSVKSCWGGSMGWGAPQAWVNALNDMKTYGKYKVVKSSTSSDYSDSLTMDILKKVKKYMKNDNTQVVISTSNNSSNDGLFASVGHIILVNNVTSDGKYFSVTDSSSKASNICGVTGSQKNHMYKDDFNFYKFPINTSTYKDKHYWIKCYWVIERIE